MKKIIFFMMVIELVGGFNYAYGQNYVDLGLKSGTKWCDVNKSGFHTYSQAVSKYGNSLPSRAHFEELKNDCKWTWSDELGGYKVTGPNGKSITLPASGCRYCDGKVDAVGFLGFYWSSTSNGSNDAWYMGYYSDDVDIDFGPHCNGFSVRLIQKDVTKSIDEFVDLGLPSGTKWCNVNETGFYTYDEAFNKYGNSLPTRAELQELKDKCEWKWREIGGWKVTGPNGKSIILPAMGLRGCFGSVRGVGAGGGLWSSSFYDRADAYSLSFNSSKVNVGSGDRCYGCSVRLVQR